LILGGFLLLFKIPDSLKINNYNAVTILGGIMKKVYILILFIFMTGFIISQEVDIKQLPPQEMLENGAMFGNLEVVKTAISKGADINYSEVVPLCKAIYGANPPPGEEGASYIQMLASAYGLKVPSRATYIELIKWMLQNGAKTTVSSDYNSDNIPLLEAAEYRDIEIIKLLLDFKVDPNQKSQTGTTALTMLTIPEPFPYPYKNAPEIAKLLISKGAKMIPKEGSHSPLNEAKETLSIIENESSPWKAYSFYDEMKMSIKSLIDIYSKL
jgi:hypothetical protein